MPVVRWMALVAFAAGAVACIDDPTFDTTLADESAPAVAAPTDSQAVVAAPEPPKKADSKGKDKDPEKEKDDK